MVCLLKGSFSLGVTCRGDACKSPIISTNANVSAVTEISFASLYELQHETWKPSGLETVCAKNYWAHWSFGPVASTDLLAQTHVLLAQIIDTILYPQNLHMPVGPVVGPHTGPLGNCLGNGAGPVLISQTVETPYDDKDMGEHWFR